MARRKRQKPSRQEKQTEASSYGTGLSVRLSVGMVRKCLEGSNSPMRTTWGPAKPPGTFRNDSAKGRTSLTREWSNT